MAHEELTSSHTQQLFAQLYNSFTRHAGAQVWPTLNNKNKDSMSKRRRGPSSRNRSSCDRRRRKSRSNNNNKESKKNSQQY